MIDVLYKVLMYGPDNKRDIILPLIDDYYDKVAAENMGFEPFLYIFSENKIQFRIMFICFDNNFKPSSSFDEMINNDIRYNAHLILGVYDSKESIDHVIETLKNHEEGIYTTLIYFDQDNNKELEEMGIKYSEKYGYEYINLSNSSIVDFQKYINHFFINFYNNTIIKYH